MFLISTHCASCSRLVHSWRCVTMSLKPRQYRLRGRWEEWEKKWTISQRNDGNLQIRYFFLFRMGDAKPNVMFVLGGPGAGKGTQCARLVFTSRDKKISECFVISKSGLLRNMDMYIFLRGICWEQRGPPLDPKYTILTQYFFGVCQDQNSYFDSMVSW